MDMTKSGAMLLGSVLAAAGAVPAGAAPQTISQRIDLAALLANPGASTSGMFDISGLLTGSPTAPINVLSGAITAYAFSDRAHETSGYNTGYYVVSQNTAYTGQQYAGYYYIAGYYYYQALGGYNCYYSAWGGRSCTPYYYYAQTPYYAPAYTDTYNTTTVRQNDYYSQDNDSVVDKIQLMTGSDVFDAQLANGPTFSSTTNGPTYAYTNYTGAYYYYGGGGNAYTDIYQDRTIHSETVNSGDINLFATLSPSALADLAFDRKIGFSVQQLVGHANVNWVQLDATVEVLETSEPGALGLLGGGATALGLAVGRRRRARDRMTVAA